MGYWLKAGQQALARSAPAEAVMQARKGLEVLSTLPDDPWHRQQELDLQIVLGWALMRTKGFSATETVEMLARAQALAEQLDRPERLVRLMQGRWNVHFARAEHRLALSLGKQIEDIGEIRNDVALKVFGRLVQGASCLWLGEIVAARALLEEHADLAYPPADPQSASYNAVYHATRLASLGVTLAYLGYIDQARSRIGQALSLARRTKYALTLAMVLIDANALDLAIGSPSMHAEELLTLSTEQKFLQWLAWALAYRGLALAALGQAQEAFALLNQGLAQLRAIGAVQGLPGLLARLAHVSAMLGQPAEAWRYLAEAAQRVEATDERVSEAEVLYRVPGDLLAAVGDWSGAERHYRQAILVAERQSAKLFQLRASISFARLWRDQGRQAEAYDLLAAIYNWFTEGFDAPILKEAKALLDELA